MPEDIGSKESIVEEIEMRLNDSRNWTVRDRETKKEYVLIYS